MPEYLAPGVYIEEVSFRSKTIEGLSTSTAGFAGPARYGPVKGDPELLTSLSDFQQVYGGLEQLVFSGQSFTHNYLAHAVRAFFEEGGERLYVSRIANADAKNSTVNTGNAVVANSVFLTGRFPGSGGNFRVTFVPRLSGMMRQATGAGTNDPPNGIGLHDTIVLATSTTDPTPASGKALQVVLNASGNLAMQDSAGTTSKFSNGTFARILTIDVVVEPPVNLPSQPTVQFGTPIVLTGFGPDPGHANSLWNYFTQVPTTRLEYLSVPFALTLGAIPSNPDLPSDPVTNGSALIEELVSTATIIAAGSATAKAADKQRQFTLAGGTDGTVPAVNEYEGQETGGGGGAHPIPVVRSGLLAFEGLDDVSIVACPGYSSRALHGTSDDIVQGIQGLLIAHCEKMRYRVAVLDSRDQMALSEVIDQRAQIDSEYAALYYPWVTILDPVTEDEILLPPSGFVTGIYARNDTDDGVEKAPANEIVRLSIGFEFLLNKAQQDVLNPLGINCFRYFPGRGYRLWGARTVSSDPEWIYINVRRYFAFLEHSIDKGTQWAVFENNSSPLWANIQSTIEDFLFNEWKNGHLLGDKPQDAYFVRCDRTTMTQNDIDNGRLVCVIGVAPVRPAEFVIFRIGQWTASSQQ